MQNFKPHPLTPAREAGGNTDIPQTTILFSLWRIRRNFICSLATSFKELYKEEDSPLTFKNKGFCMTFLILWEETLSCYLR